MSGRSTPRTRGVTGRTTTPKPRDLQVLWANVGKGQPHHIIILELAFKANVDVVCIQEPRTWPGTKTQTHPSYDWYSPVHAWHKTDELEHNAERPRVLTYVRKGAGLRTEQREPIKSRDMLWLDVNGYSILNVYREPTTSEIIDYVANLVPTAKCLIGGDFNCVHDMFEPGSATLNRGKELADWSTHSGMDFIGSPGEPTHDAGHVLDLTFSNIPFARTLIQEEMRSGSDHQTQITVLPGRGRVPLDQFHYKVPEKELTRFSDLVRIGLANLPDPGTLTNTEQIETAARHLSAVFGSAIKVVGKHNPGGNKSAPWWTPDCQQAYHDHLQARLPFGEGNGATAETRQFHEVIRRSKRDYWRKILNDVKSDASLYKVVAWHKLTPNLKSPPLEVDGRTISDTLEKAETMYTKILNRFSAADDLPDNPLDDWTGKGDLPWDATVTIEEVERNTIGVSSTSPGTDRATVRLLKASWEHVKGYIHALFSNCLRLNFFPQCWKHAEVAMIPKVGPGKNQSSVRSWRPIALLSCISKGLERIIARRIAWTALTCGLLSPQHGGALPKRSAMDLAAAFTHDVESAFARNLEVTMVTMDVQGAFDALLMRRLLRRMMEQGWPFALIQLIQSFLQDRQVRVRLEHATTQFYTAACGTPQGSPLSPILYLLYLAELLMQDPTLRFGYADDLCLYRCTKSLQQNVELLAKDVQGILDYGNANKIFFAPEKLEMIHLTRKANRHQPVCEVNDELTIEPITTAEHGKQPALRWLGVWFDRKLTWKRHIAERALKARGVAGHIRGLARTIDGPPASALRKAVITCVLPSILYGSEAWYGGRTKPPRLNRQGRLIRPSARVGGLVDKVESVIVLGARGVLPVWRTTPLPTLLRDAGLPSGEAALEEAKVRFAMRLQTVDKDHPLTRRISPPRIRRGRSAGSIMRPKTKVQDLGTLLPSIPRPVLRMPHFSPGCRTDPTGGVDKETASKQFKEWWAQLPPEDVTVFSDGSEQYIDGVKYVGYGYAVYQDGKQVGKGYGSINTTSHVFDAEAIGALTGINRVLTMPMHIRSQRVYMCIDSTSVIWSIRGDPSPSSQWAFIGIQEAMAAYDIHVKWSPGHTGIEGNEAADMLADIGAHHPQPTAGPQSKPTVSGIRSLAKQKVSDARQRWWNRISSRLSTWYKAIEPAYHVKSLPELDLPRAILHRLLAIRTTHGDFDWYHTKFKHDDAKTHCVCGRRKTPLHLVLCSRTQRRFNQWPKKTRPDLPPATRADALAYLRVLCSTPKDFEKFLRVTEFYSKFCTR